ncbi:hypothetical protein [Methylobacterium gnaphalii]|uniref:DNA primase/nucleoside triphosphatase C-terminal domain-containing protein n=1 Tax=Methylobacterium gnaphalii TaxID=1010610 RepID=A0A512JP93_9HYPH|nr:hypothetical protein [Methylobacterium gnaphalii]GEP11777.1 hypothetical protein MGN01_36220 [Methylobacterium gnaphalii]GJD69454.1 hypothetical protein MMMDOFMJ_2385 [Methylobacterium gnaphalii]GLS49588.1 hypothetical protein GCM10007885_24370 [Methylobacterium gnaphalii]
MIELSYMPGGKLLVSPHAITAIHLSPIATAAEPSSLIYMGDRSFCVAGTPDQVRASLYPKPAEKNDETVAQFIEANTISGGGETVTVADFYDSYRRWCDENGLDDLYRRQLVAEMQRLGFPVRNGSARFFAGIGLRCWKRESKR